MQKSATQTQKPAQKPSRTKKNPSPLKQQHLDELAQQMKTYPDEDVGDAEYLNQLNKQLHQTSQISQHPSESSYFGNKKTQVVSQKPVPRNEKSHQQKPGKNSYYR